MELTKAGVMQKVMSEFKKRGLDVVYADEIEAWKKCKREKDFEIKLDKQIKEEIERFIKNR